MKQEIRQILEEILEEIKIKAIKDKITQTELINKYIIAGLRNDGVKIDSDE